jgi:hypothetical protein
MTGDVTSAQHYVDSLRYWATPLVPHNRETPNDWDYRTGWGRVR